MNARHRVRRRDVEIIRAVVVPDNKCRTTRTTMYHVSLGFIFRSATCLQPTSFACLLQDAGFALWMLSEKPGWIGVLRHVTFIEQACLWRISTQDEFICKLTGTEHSHLSSVLFLSLFFFFQQQGDVKFPLTHNLPRAPLKKYRSTFKAVRPSTFQ